jgi:hypothetical protein
MIALRSALLDIALIDPNDPDTVQEEVLPPLTVIYLSFLIFLQMLRECVSFILINEECLETPSPF